MQVTFTWLPYIMWHACQNNSSLRMIQSLNHSEWQVILFFIDSLCMINPHSTNIFYRLILPCGVILTPDQYSLFSLSKMKHPVCIYFTYHTWHHLLDISYEHESQKCRSSTLGNFPPIYVKKIMAVWAKWARYSIPHNFLNICNRKSIFVSLPMFSGSRKPVLIFILHLKIFFNLFKWLQCN